MQVYGVIGNPVAHSRSPQLHNAAMEAAGLDSVYLPFLVDNLRAFLVTYSSPEYGGFSVTIPHKVCSHLYCLCAKQVSVGVSCTVDAVPCPSPHTYCQQLPHH